MAENKAAPHSFVKDGIYYFIRRVPNDLRHHYTSPKISYSLRTRSVTVAASRAATYADTLLASAEATLARADAALTSAEAAFSGANAVIKDDIPALVDGLKATVADVGNAAQELKAFAQTALPQYRDLAADARKVIASIGAVADQIGRDPGRFLLGTQTPEYRN